MTALLASLWSRLGGWAAARPRRRRRRHLRRCPKLRRHHPRHVAQHRPAEDHSRRHRLRLRPGRRRPRRAGIEPLVAIGRTRPHRPRDFHPPPAPRPPRRITGRWRLAMQAKRDAPDAKALYARRKQTVEPVFGTIKSAIGFTRCGLRGLARVASEGTLVAIARSRRRIRRVRHASRRRPRRAAAQAAWPPAANGPRCRRRPTPRRNPAKVGPSLVDPGGMGSSPTGQTGPWRSYPQASSRLGLQWGSRQAGAAGGRADEGRRVAAVPPVPPPPPTPRFAHERRARRAAPGFAWRARREAPWLHTLGGRSGQCPFSRVRIARIGRTAPTGRAGVPAPPPFPKPAAPTGDDDPRRPAGGLAGPAWNQGGLCDRVATVRVAANQRSRETIARKATIWNSSGG